MAGATQGTPEAKKDLGVEGSGGLRTVLVAGLGGLLTTAVVVGMLHTASVTSSDPVLSFVPPGEIAAAAATLVPNVRPAMVEQAKSCTVPIAYVTLASTGGEGTVQIRSGSYLSPPLKLTAAPQRVAIPYPAPYQTGRGQISIEGTANGALVSLYPTWRVDALHGAIIHNVVWTPKKPC